MCIIGQRNMLHSAFYSRSFIVFCPVEKNNDRKLSSLLHDESGGGYWRVDFMSRTFGTLEDTVSVMRIHLSFLPCPTTI